MFPKFRYSLKTLFLFITCICLALGGISIIRNIYSWYVLSTVVPPVKTVRLTTKDYSVHLEYEQFVRPDVRGSYETGDLFSTNGGRHIVYGYGPYYTVVSSDRFRKIAQVNMHEHGCEATSEAVSSQSTICCFLNIYDLHKTQKLLEIWKWDYATDQAPSVLLKESNYVRTLGLTPDGSKLAVGFADTLEDVRITHKLDQYPINIYDTNTGKHLGSCDGHIGGIVQLRFSQDGTKMLSKSHDETTRVWDINSCLLNNIRG